MDKNQALCNAICSLLYPFPLFVGLPFQSAGSAKPQSIKQQINHYPLVDGK